MAKKIKYVNNKPTFVYEDTNDDDEKLRFGGKSKLSGNIASRTDFSDEKISPKFKIPKKINKEKVSVETPSGDMGSVDRTADVIGPNMSQLNKELAKEDIKAAREFTATEMAQNLMSPGYNKKKGGMIKTKKMSSGGKVGSASKRADGIAIKGKTKGRMV